MLTLITQSIDNVVGIDSGNALSIRQGNLHGQGKTLATLVEITLGSETKSIAQGLFSALRVSFTIIVDYSLDL